MKRLIIAGIALLTVPTVLFAQGKEKEKEDKDKKEKQEVQHITITRTGDLKEKTVIEIDGDKVKINGKDIKDDKDVHVSVNTLKGTNVYRMNNIRGGNGFDFNNNFDLNDQMSLFSEDENRAMLGVNTESNEKGAEIYSITAKSSAEKAGLKKGDIITKIDDKKIESSDDLTETIRSHKPGDKVTVSILREGKEQKLTAELGKWKGINMNTFSAPKLPTLDQWKMATPEGPFNGNILYGGRPKLGLSVQDTDDGVGVKVLEVEEESNAAKSGLKKDDIILSIDEVEVKSTDDVVKATKAVKDKFTYNFKVKRDGKTQTVEVKIPRKLKTADL